MEYLPLGKHIVIKESFALGTILLAPIYHSLGRNMVKEPYHKVGGTLWFVQHWFFVYFPKLTSRHYLNFEMMLTLHTKPFDKLLTFL